MVAIYSIKSPSGKRYIGQTYDFEKRKRQYKNLHCKQQPLVYNSLKKYGFDKHKFQVLEELPADVTQKEIDLLETMTIGFYAAYFPLLNIKEGGSAGKHDERSKKKISSSTTGKRKSNETKKRISTGKKEFYATEEGRKLRTESSIKQKNVPKTDEQKKKISEGLKNYFKNKKQTV